MIVLRGYQQEAVDAGLKALDRPGAHPVIQAPTGAGKSLIIAALAVELHRRGKRVLMLTHAKELIAQNAKKFTQLWASSSEDPAPISIYSAGLKSRDMSAPVVYASVQSVMGRARSRLPAFDVVIVDESHRVSPDTGSGYRKIEQHLAALNPNTQWLGLSATPWRLGQGPITIGKGRLFTETCYTILVDTLVSQGFLIPPRTSVGLNHEMDTSKMRKRGGEFVEADLEAEAMRLVDDHAEDIASKANEQSCKSILVFAVNVLHAYALRDALRARGIEAETIEGKTGDEDRDRLVEAHRSGAIRCLTSVGVLTTGFDSPRTDMVVLARATCSSALFVQCIGRGARPFPGLKSFLLVDYGGNCERHGCWTDPEIFSSPGSHVCRTCARLLDRNALKCECGAPGPSGAQCDNCDRVYRKAAVRRCGNSLNCPLCAAKVGDVDPEKLVQERKSLLMKAGWGPRVNPRQVIGPVRVDEMSVRAGVSAQGKAYLQITYRVNGRWLPPEFHHPGGESWEHDRWSLFWVDRAGADNEVPGTAKDAVGRWNEVGCPQRLMYQRGRQGDGPIRKTRWSPERSSRFTRLAHREQPTTSSAALEEFAR